jgi:pimeloyl-ACP methyl ester carboxylesterase
MKRYLFISLFFLISCATLKVPQEFIYAPIQANNYVLVSWQKITDKEAPIYIYIEGDGNAFNYQGMPNKNPTPKSKFLRTMAFNDDNANVVYLARPCQFIKSDTCSVQDWTVGRFSEEIVEDTAFAIKQIAQEKEIILVGYSGGALLSGLIISRHPEMKINKWITIAGLLNHKDWTQYYGDMPLNLSLDLDTLPQIEQQHFVGGKDKVIPLKLSKKWINNKDLIILPNATHSTVFVKIR